MGRPALTQRLLLGTAFATAIIQAGCGAEPQPPVDAVVLIVIDTLRPDRLSCYGFPGHETPAMDRLAASGVRFENAQSPASWTVPAMGSIMTSRYPTQLGLVERPPETDTLFHWRDKRKQFAYTIPTGVVTLASLLDDAGYHPVAFVNQPLLNSGEGFQQGFAEWCFSTGEDSIAWHDMSAEMPVIVFPQGTDLAEADPLLVAEFKTWLARNADRRPFAWVHLLRPHQPYTPLVEYLPRDLQTPGARVSPAVRYAAEVREADDLVGELLAAIDSTVGLRRSLVIVVSDHGEELWDHGRFGHGHSMYREVIAVPLIIAGSSLPPGTIVRAYASTLDLAPTVLELVGARDRIPASFEGRSLLPLIQGRERGTPVYSEGMFHGGTRRSLIKDGYKLMFDAQTRPPWALYDVRKDPLETNDVIASQAPRAAGLEADITRRVAHLAKDLKSSHPPVVNGGPENQRILRALRTLGYVGKGGSSGP